MVWIIRIKISNFVRGRVRLLGQIILKGENAMNKIGFRVLRLRLLLVILLLFIGSECAYADLPMDYSEPGMYPDWYKLSMIKVLDKDIPDFNKNTLNYVYTMTAEEEALMHGHFSNYVSPIRIDPDSMVMMSTAENKVNIVVNRSLDPDYLLYTVTFTTSSSSSGSGSGTRTAIIDKENTGLSTLITQPVTGVDDSGRILIALDAIIAEVRRPTNPQEAEKAYLGIIQTLKHLGLLLDRIQDKGALTSRIAELTDAARNLILQINEPGRAADLSVLYINGMSQVLTKIDLTSSPALLLKTKLQGLAGEASDKVGTYRTNADNVSFSGGKGVISYDEADLLRHTEWAIGKHQAISSALVGQLGGSDPRKVYLTITLETPREENVQSLQGNLPGSTVEAIKGKGADKIRFKLGEAAVTVSSEDVKGSSGELSFKSTFLGAPDTGLPGGITVIPGTFSVDAVLTLGDTPMTASTSPILLTLDLAGLNLSGYTESALRKLGMYLLNEESGKWTPVGGNYDPVARRITASRQHLSKYTVLKADRSFSDVENSWAKDDINELLSKGIVKESTGFSPKGDLTREEFARWIAKAYGLEGGSKDMPFSDVPKDHPYYNELSAAYSQGLIKGKNATVFDPKGKITRQEMATLISNALIKYEKAKTDSALVARLNKYPDSKQVAGWAVGNVAMVNELGIMQGDARGFRPLDYITREEAARVMKRIYN